MKKYLLLALLFLALYSQAQNLPDFIKQNAINLKSDALFEQIKDYKCLMIGEMHGTEEAAAFLTDLVKTSSQHGKSILLGIEIPASDMARFIKKPTTKNLKKTTFFKQGYGDGRSSEAWFRLIEDCKKLKNVEFCFFDVETNSNEQNRDSIMFIHLINTYQKDTTKVIYTISGNIHNKIKPFRNNKTLGYYMVEYFSKYKLISINHLYGSGTVYNNNGEGLKIRDIKGMTGIFATSAPFENYFLSKLPAGIMDDYSGIIYTKNITASLPIKH